jgi:hypothetical protein
VFFYDRASGRPAGSKAGAVSQVFYDQGMFLSLILLLFN